MVNCNDYPVFIECQLIHNKILDLKKVNHTFYDISRSDF